MDADALVDAARDSLWVLVQMIAPVVVPALAMGLLVGLVQAATSISEATLSFVPKLVTVLVCLLLFGALMMRVLIDFTLDLHARIPALLQ